jgi:aminomethyltransferase
MLDQTPHATQQQSPRPSVILRPGLPALPPGVERYRIAGRGIVALRVRAGDAVMVRDVEGGQACELVAAGSDGRVDTGGILGAHADGDAAGLKGLLGQAGEEASATRRTLERNGVDLAAARAMRLFGMGSRAGSTAEFLARRDGIVVAAAPGPVMDFDRQDTATPIELLIRRAAPRSAGEEPLLPEPLADPLIELRVRRMTAQAYVVRAGEYIQVIDVAGRQCTDFQCFSARKLDMGRELALDSTVTRTLLGRSYPMPGLPSKAFDRDMEPLVEIIRDTCGRHDAFATACNPRYYDDMGYPGHVNCSENFNRVLAPYGVQPRPGWEAINYFYNTAIDAQNQLYLDEPWSRPGDYVLMRALTDLVCVSSACPDDIDAANGWDPTDIHVRTYSGKQRFSRAVATRMTPDADPQLTRETAFHDRFSKLTRNFAEYRGFWLPTHFNDGPVAEYWACREAAAVMDLSPLRKFEVTGPDAEALLQYCLTRDMRRLSPGQVVYSAMCYEHGGMIDDGTALRLGQNNFRWIGGDDYSGIWLREQADKLGFKAWVRSSTDQMHNIAVQGPNSRDILKQIIWTPPARPQLEELGWFRFTVGRIGAFEGPPVVVSRIGYTGELGYEIFCHPKDAAAVFDAVWEAGEPRGLKPLGLEALDMLRIEAGLVFAHYEFSDDTDPFEAGIGFTVPLKSKSDDFIGRQALIERKAHPRRKLVGLEMDGNDPVGHGDCVHVGRAQIGVVTSATRSPILKKTIALARVDVAHAEIGTALEVGKLDGHQKRLPARIVRFPHYDPDKSRVRS